ncbi:MAG: AraC family transcriptional regulator ligand-binding domain-containing protein [Nannocystaceae bacterium]|nr:AraC family transcriptional regulator [bacterium]
MSAERDYRLAPVWRAAMADLGINPADVLRLAGLPEDLLTQAEIRCTAAEFVALWRAAESQFPDGELAVEGVKLAAAETFTPELFAALCSPTLDVALDRLALYKQLCAPVRIDLVRHPDESRTATLHWIDLDNPAPPSMAAMELIFISRVARMGTRRKVSPIRAEMTLPPERLGPYEEYLGIEVSTGSSTALTFSSDVLHAPFLTSSESLWSVFEPELRRRMASLQTDSSTAERVRAVLLESLPGGRANIADVSRRLGVSARTLQRRLRAEDVSFNAVLAEVREKLARHYLAKTDLPCNEIAFLLGYEEPNSFFRAFQGWTGQSPQRHRKSVFVPEAMH